MSAKQWLEDATACKVREEQDRVEAATTSLAGLIEHRELLQQKSEAQKLKALANMEREAHHEHRRAAHVAREERGRIAAALRAAEQRVGMVQEVQQREKARSQRLAFEAKRASDLLPYQSDYQQRHQQRVAEYQRELMLGNAWGTWGSGSGWSNWSHSDSDCVTWGWSHWYSDGDGGGGAWACGGDWYSDGYGGGGAWARGGDCSGPWLPGDRGGDCSAPGDGDGDRLAISSGLSTGPSIVSRIGSQRALSGRSGTQARTQARTHAKYFTQPSKSKLDQFADFAAATGVSWENLLQHQQLRELPGKTSCSSSSSIQNVV